MWMSVSQEEDGEGRDRLKCEQDGVRPTRPTASAALKSGCFEIN